MLMKVLVTGVAGQLGHDVMNELAKRGYEGIGSDIKDTYQRYPRRHRRCNYALRSHGHYGQSICRKSPERSQS